MIQHCTENFNHHNKIRRINKRYEDKKGKKPKFYVVGGVTQKNLQIVQVIKILDQYPNSMDFLYVVHK